jgi:HPt (histidine-containing phosphotransfer) domain-containing protein
MCSKSRNSEIIDHEILNNVRSLGEDVFVEMVDLIFEESSALFAEISRAFLDGNTDQLKALAHNIKGASSSMGAAASISSCIV